MATYQPAMAMHELDTLPQLWRRWTEVVRLFASGASSRLRLNPAEYQALHRALLQAFHAQGAGPERTVWLRSVEQLVQPWLSASALEHADRELLADLLGRCRDIEKTPSGRAVLKPSHQYGRLALQFLGWLLAPLLLLAAAVWLWPPLGESLWSAWLTLRFQLRDWPDFGLWAGGSGLLLLVFVLIAIAGTARR
jgi:hypothetical protein